MFSGLGLGNILGSPTGLSSAQGIANGYNPYAQQAGLASQAAAAQQHWMSIHARQHAPARWMVDGRSMSFEEFVQTVFPEDTPERTFFLLKYTK